MWVELARLRDIRIRAVEIAQAEFRETAMVVRHRRIRLQFDRLIIILDRKLEVQTVRVSEPAAIESDPEFRAKLYRVTVILDRFVVGEFGGISARALSDDARQVLAVHAARLDHDRAGFDGNVRIAAAAL